MIGPWQVVILFIISAAVFALIYFNEKPIKKWVAETRAKGELSERLNKAIISVVVVLLLAGLFLGSE